MENKKYFNIIEELQKQVSEYIENIEEVTKLVNLIDNPQQ